MLPHLTRNSLLRSKISYLLLTRTLSVPITRHGETVSSIKQKEESKGNEAQVSMIKGYRENTESELAKICEDILDDLDKHLIPLAA